MSRPRGSIERRGSGWRYRISYTDADGKVHKPSRQGFATKREAQVAMTAHLQQLDSAPARRRGPRTTGQYLTGWLDLYERSGSRKRSTTATTRQHVTRYLIPRIGHVPLSRLTAEHLTGLYAELVNEGGTGLRMPAHDPEHKVSGLSPKTVRNIAGTMHKALSDAVKRGYLYRNPADGVDLPRWERAELTVWDETQVARFLHHAAAADNVYLPLWRLLLTTGMRRGELLGLRWSDVDLVAGTVTVAQSRVETNGRVTVESPKTRAGRRTIAIDPDTVTLLARLKDAHEAAAETYGVWTSPYVATNLDGRPIYPRTLTRHFQATAKAAGLPSPRLHDGRHTAATLALQHGVPVNVVAGRLGHAKVSTTLDVYAAFLPTADRLASDVIGRALRSTTADLPPVDATPKGPKRVRNSSKGPKLDELLPISPD